jgi:uncharacterized protein YndB with AHSA1/START domain
MIEPPGYVVRIERTFDAPAEAVFDAWTRPEVMRRWFHVGPDWETPEAEVDRRPDGTEHVIAGEYTEVAPPHRLVFACTFSDDPDNEQLVELTFTESEGSTTVVLINSGISTDDRRDAQDYGWYGCLDQLERALGV